MDANAPQLDGTGEIRIESAERGSGYFTTRADNPTVNARTAGVYLRADPEDCLSILDGRDERKRAELIAEQLRPIQDDRLGGKVHVTGIAQMLKIYT